jgi:hypothetical protein
MAWLQWLDGTPQIERIKVVLVITNSIDTW